MSLRVLELTYIDYISMLHCIQSYKFILEVTLKHKNTKKNINIIHEIKFFFCIKITMN